MTLLRSLALLTVAAFQPLSAATVSLFQLVMNAGTPDGTLVIGDKVLYNFTFSLDSGSKPVSAQSIVLTTSEADNNPGLRIQSNQLQVAPGDHIGLNFDFSIDDGGRGTIEDASQALTSYDVSGSALIAVNEFFGDLRVPFVGTDIDLTRGIMEPSSELTFQQPASNLRVHTNINMSAFDPAGSANLRTFTENFSEIPEPTSGILCVIGAVVILVVAGFRARYAPDSR